jgi:hypothetical protein
MLVVFTIFVIPLLPVAMHMRSYNIVYSLIFFASAGALHSKRRFMMIIAVIAFITEWIAEINEAQILMYLSRFTNIAFFVVVVIRLIIQIARYETVSLVVIVEAITGYLLMGILFGIPVYLIMMAEPGAYSFSTDTAVSITDVNYYTFVTLSTLGYGDLLPLTPVSKSLTLLITLSGQLYLAIIIATLVGKFLSQNQQQGHD